MKPAGWEDRLAAEVASAARRAWRWGEHDCASFALACIRAQLGADAWADSPGWSSALEAARVIRAEGGLAAFMDRRAERVRVRFAQRGDVAAFRLDRDGRLDGEPGFGRVWMGEPSLGVVTGARALIAAAPRGVDYAPTLVAETVWRIDGEVGDG